MDRQIDAGFLLPRPRDHAAQKIDQMLKQFVVVDGRRSDPVRARVRHPVKPRAHATRACRPLRQIERHSIS